jgi:hypothetical protein
MDCDCRASEGLAEYADGLSEGCWFSRLLRVTEEAIHIICAYRNPEVFDHEGENPDSVGADSTQVRRPQRALLLGVFFGT